MEIRKVEPIYKSSFNLNKDREKQNEEKRRLLLLKKMMIKALEKGTKGRTIDIRI